MASAVVDSAYWSRDVTIATMIVLALVLLLIAALPIWKWSKVWGYTPSIWVVLMLGAHLYTVATTH